MLTDAQIELLEAKARELVDLALVELDLSQWPSLDSKEGRGDRVWMKKNAAESLRLVDQIRSVLRPALTPLPTVTVTPEESDEQIAARLTREAEKRAGSMRVRSEPTTPH